MKRFRIFDFLIYETISYFWYPNLWNYFLFLISYFMKRFPVFDFLIYETISYF